MIYNEKNEYKYYHGHDHNHDGCEHSHEHSGHNHVHRGHSHAHEVSADCDCKSDLSKDEETLRILLDHWVEHNESHEDGFKEWVKKAISMGKLETAEFIQKAVEFMQEADKMLMEAKENM
ncbi:hypothetical protein [Clostridium magnum]|uniref:DUF8180 domain-containing protein n=1 Tax=Clostridium magnum DSM 2767 TaxID=1121326 RepID=A0A162TIA6_9CLOT|nr:hypothetical protein [Clostridium magnum]KZL92680.1 hypothetical protein CLMAG_24940 [Clostridium magnum DSM 2767]SHI24431.1 hypothetical protein SAMN02745944_03551 [Clostridium magnum DSM 2767]